MVNTTNIKVSSVRKIKGKVELYNGSALSATFNPDDNLQEITIARTGEQGKFFGFGVCQQATVKIVDKAGNIAVNKGDTLRTYFNVNDSEYDLICPSFYAKDVKRDEKTNVITVAAYDALDASISHVVSELNLTPPYTLKSVTEACASLLGLSVNITDPAFDLVYETGANFSGTETIRSVLNAIAEVTQTIYYVNHEEELIFKALDKTGDPVLKISKNEYFELTTAVPVTITKIIHVTELGDNIEHGTDEGVVQYIRDNPFWTLRTDLGTLVPEALNRITGLTIMPYNTKWRGNYYSEIGDKIEVEAKDCHCESTFILNDTLSYTGGMNQVTSWEYTPESDRITAANPATLGEKLNQTFARVDKVNKEITLYSSDIAETKESIGELKLTSQEINASVSAMEQRVTDVEGDTSEKIDEIYNTVSTKLDKNGVEITVEQKLAEGVEKVVTASKKYTFDDSGLKIKSSSSNISTTITEDGMTIERSGHEVLTANNEGVKAEDLHATTYLIIGNTSRLEDYNNRTTCYWIGD